MKRTPLKRKTPLKRTGFNNRGEGLSRGGELKRSPLKRQSSRNRARAEEAKPFRDALIALHGECWICGTNEKKSFYPIKDLNKLCVHELGSGPLRQKFLDEACGTLCLCWGCNGTKVENKGEYPITRQLAILLEKNPEGYDLVRFNWLVNPNAPNRIEQWEVDQWLAT